MTFSVNTSPFAGQEGKFVTSRNLKVRAVPQVGAAIVLLQDCMGGGGL